MLVSMIKAVVYGLVVGQSAKTCATFFKAAKANVIAGGIIGTGLGILAVNAIDVSAKAVVKVIEESKEEDEEIETPEECPASCVKSEVKRVKIVDKILVDGKPYIKDHNGNYILWEEGA